ncbi:hypothetical protein JOM56_000264 [Amanita muscaria]
MSPIQTFSLEDLAVSFITETISTLKQTTTPTLVSSPIEELGARQKQLEQYIAESRVLMTQLTQARTKQEKDRLLGLMREKTRCVGCSYYPPCFLLWAGSY